MSIIIPCSARRVISGNGRHGDANSCWCITTRSSQDKALWISLSVPTLEHRCRSNDSLKLWFFQLLYVGPIQILASEKSKWDRRSFVCLMMVIPQVRGVESFGDLLRPQTIIGHASIIQSWWDLLESCLCLIICHSTADNGHSVVFVQVVNGDGDQGSDSCSSEKWKRSDLYWFDSAYAFQE